MKEIAKRLHENKQVKLAKEILETAGYKVSKKEDTAPIKEAIGAEFIESVEEFKDLLTKAVLVLENTEEGVIESVIGDDDLYDNLKNYVEALDSALRLAKRNRRDPLN